MTVPSPYLDDRGWPVIDRLLVAYFTATVALDDDVPVHWATALGTDVEFPACRVMRLPGGGINRDQYEDVSRIEVTTFGRTRQESDALTAQVRQGLADLDNDEFAGVGIDAIREENGPGRIPDPDEDLRAVPTVWSITARQQ